MQSFDSGRRFALAALGAFALACGVPAYAQDPGLNAAKAAALEWLVIADRNDAAGTYKAAAQRFRDQITADRWAEAMKQVQDQFGAVSERTFIGGKPVEPQKGDPQGTFMLVGFRTEFAKRKSGQETVTLERESDGKWRVVGYLMQ